MSASVPGQVGLRGSARDHVERGAGNVVRRHRRGMQCKLREGPPSVAGCRGKRLAGTNARIRWLEDIVASWPRSRPPLPSGVEVRGRGEGPENQADLMHAGYYRDLRRGPAHLRMSALAVCPEAPYPRGHRASTVRFDVCS
jgi:hypothetical protein